MGFHSLTLCEDVDLTAFGSVQRNTGRRLYFEERKDYKEILIKLLLATVDRLQLLGVGVRATIDDDIKQNDITKEAA